TTRLDASRGAVMGIGCGPPKSMSVPAIEAPLRSVIGMLEERNSNAQTFKTMDWQFCSERGSVTYVGMLSYAIRKRRPGPRCIPAVPRRLHRKDWCRVKK
ncbi:hypothetical protein, partial [Azospirillum brasilense]|uniref:hypothetical protein n=1 Tax=Azospirillum brasilense TaxID=192 RepID=UPI001B3BCA95